VVDSVVEGLPAEGGHAVVRRVAIVEDGYEAVVETSVAQLGKVGKLWRICGGGPVRGVIVGIVDIVCGWVVVAVGSWMHGAKLPVSVLVPVFLLASPFAGL
jgi:hypothetical protein